MGGVLDPTNWLHYYAFVGAVPNPIVYGVLARNVEKRGVALDVGAGNYRDSVLLRNAGFERVIAVEPSIYAPATPQGIERFDTTLQNLRFPQNTFDYIICCNTLFYVPAADIIKFLNAAYEWLRPGGVLVCNACGERDDWATAGTRGYLTTQAVNHLRNTLPGCFFEETETDDLTSLENMKHWHLWTLVLKKPKD